MLSTFTLDERRMLEENYRLTYSTSTSNLSTPLSQLMNDENLKMYLSAVKDRTKAANLGVAASLFVKRYSFAVLIALYSMSVLNKKINFSINNISIQTFDESDILWLPYIKFDCLDFCLSDKIDDRVTWRNKFLTEIFADHIEVIFNNFGRISKLSKRIMWENLYTYIVWMYRNVLTDENYVHQHHTIKEDFNWLTSVKDGSIFSEYNENPFLKFRGSKDINSILEGDPHKRITCCLSYLTESKGAFCNGCPIARKRNQKE